MGASRLFAPSSTNRRSLAALLSRFCGPRRWRNGVSIVVAPAWLCALSLHRSRIVSALGWRRLAVGTVVCPYEHRHDGERQTHYCEYLKPFGFTHDDRP